jgi:ABC-type transporter Mla subunit MlaD
MIHFSPSRSSAFTSPEVYDSWQEIGSNINLCREIGDEITLTLNEAAENGRRQDASLAQLVRATSTLTVELAQRNVNMREIEEGTHRNGVALERASEALDRQGEALNRQGEALNRQGEALNRQGEELDRVKKGVEKLEQMLAPLPLNSSNSFLDILTQSIRKRLSAVKCFFFA